MPTEAASIAVVDRAISVLSVIVLGFIAYMLSPKTKGNRTASAEIDRRPRPRRGGLSGPGAARRVSGSGAPSARAAISGAW